jgi:transposase-like protein
MGAVVTELCRRHGMSSATYHAWKAKFGGLEVSDGTRPGEVESFLEVKVTAMTQQRWFTKEFDDEAVRLVATSGRTQREIAEYLGVGLSTLVRWISRSRDRLLERRRRQIRPPSGSAFGERMRSIGRSATY